jgi:peptidoglycan/LPS O-acetylase OafA/YrhL
MGDRRYWPSLDGIRAVAIGLVVAFHLGHLGGGWLGVDVFFVLSGFLITTQLLVHRTLPAGAWLRAFWARRARRLLPAVLLLVLVIAIYAWAGGPGVVAAQLRDPALATLAYVANWQQLSAGGYFAQFAAPDPLMHTWSLAIEEQFYLVWPILLLAITALVGNRRPRLAVVTGALAVASAGWSVAVFNLWGVNRAYLGTDTRAWELLLGAVLAMTLGEGRPARPRRWSVASVVAGLGFGCGVALAGGTPRWLFDGGTVALAAAVAVVLAVSVRVPTALLPRLLALPPMRWVGRISYSLYLWHWPAIVLMTPSTTGLTGTSLLVVRLSAMTAAASASFYLLEQPLRHADWRGWRRRALVPVSVFATGAAVLVATVTPVAATTTAVVAPLHGTAQSAAAVTAVRTVADALGGQTVSAANPVRVWLFGDSVLNDASPGVTAALDATGDAKVVADTTFPGWSFAHDPGWRSQWQQVIATDHPQVVMATWSWDDQTAATHPKAYEQFLRGALDVVMAPGDGVELLVLLQFPQVGPPASAYNGQLVADAQTGWKTETTIQRAWDRLAQRVVATWPGHAVYLPTDAVFDPGGRWFAWFKTPDGGWLRARKIDDFHFCPYGAATFGAFLVSQLDPVLHLGPENPGWESGNWVHDPRFNDPPGACPDDQPPPGYRGVKVPRS